MNIFVVSVFAVAMIGLMIPSSFGTNTVTSSSLQFQFNIPDEWIEENSYIHLWKLYNSQDRTLERFPAVKISSPDNKILMYVTEDVTYNVKSIGEMDNFCHNMLEGEIYCDSLTKIEEKCVETINGCYQVTKFPYKTSDSPQVKTLKVAYWYKIGEGTPKGEDNCAQTRGCFTNVFFVYDSELEKSGSFNHKSIMSKFQIDDQKSEFGSFSNEEIGFSIKIPSDMSIEYSPGDSDFFPMLFGGTELVIVLYDEGVDYSELSNEKKLERILELEKELAYEDGFSFYVKDKEIIEKNDMTFFNIVAILTDYTQGSLGLYDDEYILRISEVHADDRFWGIYYETIDDSPLEKSGDAEKIFKTIIESFSQYPNNFESSSKSNSEIAKIMSSKIIQGEPYNLLVIEVQINEDEWGHGPNLSGMESGFNINERDTKIFTDDFTFFGTTIPKNTLWDENCPIYVVKKAYPDMPIYFTLCFEIPKSESNFILKHTSPAWQGKLEFSVESQSSVSIPTWIKNNAGWWAEGQIDDNSFVQGIQFMIKENIFSIPNLPESSETAESVPAWVKNNAGWWAEGQIDDNSFVKGIEYLVKVGIIQVS